MKHDSPQVSWLTESEKRNDALRIPEVCPDLWTHQFDAHLNLIRCNGDGFTVAQEENLQIGSNGSMEKVLRFSVPSQVAHDWLGCDLAWELVVEAGEAQRVSSCGWTIEDGR